MSQREAYVCGHIAWLKGETEAHPGGVSGKRQIIDRHEGKDCWDTAPRAWHFSEYAE